MTPFPKHAKNSCEIERTTLSDYITINLLFFDVISLHRED